MLTACNLRPGDKSSPGSRTMKSIRAGAALAATIACAGAAKADYINAIGYAPTLIYNGQTIHLTGPISATFYYEPNFFETGYGSPGGADFSFKSNGVSYSIGFVDDGYGRQFNYGHEIDVLTTYVVPDFTTESHLNVSDGNTTFVDGQSYVLTTGFSSIVSSSYVTHTYNPDTAMLLDFTVLDLEFVPVSVGINATAVLPVPVPASAPMLGASLIALGAAGYAARCKKAAAA